MLEFVLPHFGRVSRVTGCSGLLHSRKGKHDRFRFVAVFCSEASFFQHPAGCRGVSHSGQDLGRVPSIASRRSVRNPTGQRGLHRRHGGWRREAEVATGLFVEGDTEPGLGWLLATNEEWATSIANRQGTHSDRWPRFSPDSTTANHDLTGK